MNKQELRTLRGQLLLLGGLFASCMVAAALMASQRGFFEKFIKEKYQELPASLKTMADNAVNGRLDKEAFTRLSPAQRLALYDDWMLRPEPPPAQTPRALVTADPDLYFARAERTLVCGSSGQKLRALKFLKLARSKDAIPMLKRVHEWAVKRRTLRLAEAITETILELEQTTQPEQPIASQTDRRCSLS